MARLTYSSSNRFPCLPAFPVYPRPSFTHFQCPLPASKARVMRFALLLAVLLVAFWLTLSGYFKPLLLVFGAISIGVTLVLVARMRILDRETVPYSTLPQTLSYFTWLFAEIVRANIAVVRAVMRPDLVVTPTLVEVPMDRVTDLGRTMFANSITLTPGTVSVALDERRILVHALLADMTDPDGFAEMQGRAGWAVGEPITASEAERLALRDDS